MSLPAFRRPLGLALSGAGSMGAWQAGLMHSLVDAGLSFDRVWGFSAGALNATAYFAGRVEINSRLWQSMEPRNVLRVSPRHWPSGALFSDRFIREVLETWVDEEQVRAAARCSLHIVSYDVDENLSTTASFDPGGRWDGRLVDHVAASCAIPYVFPPVKIPLEGKTRTFIDGGVPGKMPLDLQPLADCKDILVVSVARPDETTDWALNPVTWFTRRAKRLIHHQMRGAASSTSFWPQAPRLFSLLPSRPLRYSMLNFTSRRAQESFRLGREDAAAFLSSTAVPA